MQAYRKDKLSGNRGIGDRGIGKLGDRNIGVSVIGLLGNRLLEYQYIGISGNRTIGILDHLDSCISVRRPKRFTTGIFVKHPRSSKFVQKRTVSSAYAKLNS